MKEDILLQIFHEETNGKNYANGQKLINDDLVSCVSITDDSNLLCIDGNVISENLFNEYKTKIEMDIGKKSIFSTFCSCEDFEKNEFKKRNYCCKHLTATFYKALEELLEHPLLNDKTEKEDNIDIGSDIISLLTHLDDQREKIKIEIYLKKNEWDENIAAELKLGLSTMSSSSLYVVKDINQLLLSIYNKIPISFSKNFIFDIKKQTFETKDKCLLDFIGKLKAIDISYRNSSRNAGGFVEGKYINIPNYLLREFFQTVKEHRVYLNEGFFSRPVETEILLSAPAVDFDLKLIKGEYVLKSPGGMPLSLGMNNDVFLYGADIYLPDYDFCYNIKPYMQVFNKSKIVVFESSKEETVLRRLIPELNKLTANITLSKNIQDKIVISNCFFNFYFHKKDNDIMLTLKVKYGAFEFNIFDDIKDKVIYRDVTKERQMVSYIKSLGFEESDGKFYFQKDDEYVFRLFKYEISKLQEIGEVYYSDNFKGIKSLGAAGFSGDIRAGKYNYFEMDFKIGDISEEETSNILRAFKDNIKYYKLKNGEYLDLEELELKKLLKLIDSVSTKNISGNHISIPRNKAIYFKDFLEEQEIRYINGKSELEKIKDKFNNISKLEFKVPKIIKGKLREYQKIGYNWMKTLEHLGFGGILGDEMGLGKTLQTITFIASNPNSKTLIVAPTSLVFNWVSEFEKFAPEVKTAAVNGSKEEREILLKEIEKYDVLITTYNLLKRDLDIYRDIQFNYCILDEAQNIKNSNSQNAAAVKEIRSDSRFALSGTPIENSLMELWSIFDFIMPGYLYDEKRFSVRYHKRLKEEPVVIEELNKLIKPFILRRRKKEVIKELPDKIEKTLLVDMSEEQKKVYGAYAKYAVELIEKKVKDYEFQNSKIEILAYITKLRQLCLDPSLIMEDYIGGCGKIEALVELLHKSLGEGHRVLVFSQFTSVLKNIGARISLENISYSYLDGSISAEKRMVMVRNFNEGENSVFLISLKAGGTGLNLTSADVVIHFDPWWNPAVEEQATDRAHRIGQENVVEVIKLVAKGSIEEKIIKLQEQKKKLISELMGDDFADGKGLAGLNYEEVIELFKLN